jgi:hypothetical protein
MTTLAEARESVYQRFLERWDLSHPTVPYALDNEDFAPPTDGSPWARVSLRNMTSVQDTLGMEGARRWHRRALVMVQIFTPINEGAGSADVLAATVRGMFEGASFEGLDFEASLIREGVPDGRWWLVLVESPLSYYETR